MISVGTSGFDYDDWRGPFYPVELSKAGFLEFYAQHFSALELNYTYYRMPQAASLERMLRRTEGRVVFSVKAHASMTHDRVAGELDVRAFFDALAPLRAGGALGAVLLQFPHSFHLTAENRRYIYQLRQQTQDPLVCEFRNAHWAVPSVYDWLRSINLAYCCVDEPDIEGLMPRVAVVCASPAYVRFHGRNGRQWYQHDNPAQRYDYRYSSRELAEWVPLVERLDAAADRTLVFFNNHFQAKAVNNARTFAHLLHGSISMLKQADGPCRNVGRDIR